MNQYLKSMSATEQVKREPGEDRRAFLERARDAVMALRDV